MWLRFRSSPQNLVEGRDSAVIKEKASGAGDVAIRRMRNPRTGCSRRLRSRKAPVRKSGGAFLPTARQTGPSHHDRRRSLDSGAPRTGSLAQRKACLFPTDLRLQYQLRPKAEHRHRRGPPQRMARCQRNAATPWTGRQVFNENDLAFPLDDRGEYGKPHQPKPSTPDDLPWEGRQLPANARHSDLSLRGRAKPEDAARRFRVLQGRLILVGVRDNRVEAGGEQNSVNKSTGRTHFIVPLSTERPTRARLR